ncbi:MAG: TRAP transporter TatT component family protein [Treponema sp.]|jgi:predicted anti-sigma-YlaC factor YlaD|nr:TRAP transporter TatT component family protein [Treponema sp.]
MKSRFPCFPFIVPLALFLFSACSINKLAINAVSDALTAEGSGEVFTGDSDPRLVGDAIPFAIKMYEALLSSNPNHQGLILTTGSLFVMYANAFVQGPAELLPRIQYAERQAAMERAKKLYLRGAEILYGGLEKKYPGFREGSRGENFPQILAKLKKADVPALYWSAAGYLSAFSLNPFDMTLGVKIPELMVLVDRAYALDPDFNNGALDDLLVLAHASLPESMGGDKSRVETHFRRSLEKSLGRLAGPYVSYASAVLIPAQDYEAFKTCLETALALDPDADPANRLVNILAQRKARYLLDNAGLYFVDYDTGDWDD